MDVGHTGSSDWQRLNLACVTNAAEKNPPRNLPKREDPRRISFTCSEQLPACPFPPPKRTAPHFAISQGDGLDTALAEDRGRKKNGKYNSVQDVLNPLPQLDGRYAAPDRRPPRWGENNSRYAAAGCGPFPHTGLLGDNCAASDDRESRLHCPGVFRNRIDLRRIAGG